MPSYLTSIVLEFSEDDLSDTTPTWQDVTAYLIDIEWWAGIDNEGDDPEPGGCTIRLKNTNRDWEPEYTGSRFYPNVTSHRRFRLTLNSVQQGVWYTSNFQVSYPADGNEYSEVTIGCGDGCEVLALDTIELMDPPDADAYAEVVGSDEPLGYWRLGEPAGTKVVAQIRRVKKHRGKKRRKVRVRREVAAAELEGTAGPAGNYINSPALAQDSMIVGDRDTCVLFGEKGASATNYGRVLMDDNVFSEPNMFSASMWVARNAIFGTDRVFFAGPFNTTASANIFTLKVIATTHVLELTVQLTGGAITATSTSATGIFASGAGGTHVGASWDGSTARLYVNGVLEASTGGSGTLRAGNTTEYVYLGTKSNPVATSGCYLDEVAVFENVLTDERFAAHYEAGAERGWPMQTAGERIADIVTHDLWSEASVQTSGRDVLPQFKHGQGRLELVAELGRSEGPTTQFFFNRSGNPVYLGHEWQSTDANYNTVQATFGWSAGELPYDAIEPVHDNETYNEVVVTHESGEPATVTGSGVPRRVNTDYTDVLLHEHEHVESLAAALFAFYENPAFRPKSMTVNGSKCLAQILDLDLGHLIRVKGPGSSSWDRVAHIIGKRYSVNADKVMAATYTLGRGFNADDGVWHAGIVGFSEAGSTTVAA